jgi:hypothetical protein
MDPKEEEEFAGLAAAAASALEAARAFRRVMTAAMELAGSGKGVREEIPERFKILRWFKNGAVDTRVFVTSSGAYSGEGEEGRGRQDGTMESKRSGKAGRTVRPKKREKGYYTYNAE